MKAICLVLLLAFTASCTLVGLGGGAAFDHAAGTDHAGKEVGLRIGLGIDLAIVTLVMSLAGRR